MTNSKQEQVPSPTFPAALLGPGCGCRLSYGADRNVLITPENTGNPRISRDQIRATGAGGGGSSPPGTFTGRRGAWGGSSSWFKAHPSVLSRAVANPQFFTGSSYRGPESSVCQTGQEDGMEDASG